MSFVAIHESKCPLHVKDLKAIRRSGRSFRSAWNTSVHGEERHSLNPCLRDRTLAPGIMKLFFFRLKDDYSGFDETDFSTRIAPAARETRGCGRQAKEVVPGCCGDEFLSSLACSERIMNSGVRRSLGAALPRRALSFARVVLSFLLSIPLFCLQ